MGNSRKYFLKSEIINPEPIQGDLNVSELVDKYFLAYNSKRIKEICQLLTKKVLKKDVTVGLSLSGALTPAGLGRSVVVPLIKSGFVDWITSTGANLYHDTHFGLNLELRQGSPFLDDTELKNEKIVRIYDIIFDYDVLLSTDRFYREILRLPEFQKEMGTAELHYLIGKYLFEREKALGIKIPTLLSSAYQYGVPVYTPSPGDSSIGMNIAEVILSGGKLRVCPFLDVNETAAIVLDAKRAKGKSAVLIVGGGAPKNFMLQTEPQIQEVLKLDEKGHDYFMQITDARADTGGLSGATPSEAVSWGKVDEEMLPDAVVAYIDFTVALPVITSYVLSKAKPRKHKRLYDKREELLGRLQKEFLKKP
ncbi:MAG: deoxyhypusine synthase [Candidatus Schekmanbacteria bacterium RIFCSPHIGHO2_02_FULL_38_11]|uniref:Deoxyhypusine synthase n=1 Tax=Candidatus Schekmanbacteria bacterium RIFCSPLOWO2_12_FULL_38_15 TaxID=1817883 RepID=A0A1F7SHL9_9BACT|nr:MAG: deoxyhypusine synthase [Candidatus Schekmanbacteria bacterium GWA2_38_9]OGL49540.1 MAG: deoxyhypusine synthase [Candidatus Schekmanbacteria bacterium RIFCSPLOWO2_02_FULL_38_14]OGL52728.1 MAG: deoxyhypusine synthase [Candidatus Schekmanbacteria bacterium RIFCSPLOWO2_12_FULL_38_15]OGL53954.1 MAG: deoxyhypusine synthase [Candidatus Schekmanbacteria bacterium RIFCSPHIGHO2_02_FULL_38_11]